jgi:4-hydroxybenzoate polyprenyltransferase
MGSARALVRASHFPPTLAVTAFTTALAVSSGRAWGAAAVAAAVLCGQLTVGWSNDYIDRDRDRTARRADKPIAAGQVSAGIVRNSAVAAAVACVPLSLLSGWRAGSVHFVAVVAAVAYNVRLKRTVFSVVPYVVAFGLLPAFVTLGADEHSWPPAWAMTAAALLGAGAHFLNTLPDLAADASSGVRGLPHRCGATGTVVIGGVLLGVATAIVALAPGGALGVAGVVAAGLGAAAVLGVVALAVLGRPRQAWLLSLGAAAAVVALYLVRGV